MLRLDDPGWVSAGIARPHASSAYGGFIAQWAGAVDWLEDHRGLGLEAAKQALLDSQLATPIDMLRRSRGGHGGAELSRSRMPGRPCGHSNLQAFCWYPHSLSLRFDLHLNMRAAVPFRPSAHSREKHGIA
jgi:hypothetical protein